MRFRNELYCLAEVSLYMCLAVSPLNSRTATKAPAPGGGLEIYLWRQRANKKYFQLFNLSILQQATEIRSLLQRESTKSTILSVGNRLIVTLWCAGHKKYINVWRYSVNIMDDCSVLNVSRSSVNILIVRYLLSEVSTAAIASQWMYPTCNRTKSAIFIGRI